MASGIDPSALRTARESAGLTQHELARLVGAAGGERVSRWELGASVPRPDFLVKLARALDIPTLRLIHLEGDTPDLRALRLQAGLTVPELATRTNMAGQDRTSGVEGKRVSVRVDLGGRGSIKKKKKKRQE